LAADADRDVSTCKDFEQFGSNHNNWYESGAGITMDVLLS